MVFTGKAIGPAWIHPDNLNINETKTSARPPLYVFDEQIEIPNLLTPLHTHLCG